MKILCYVNHFFGQNSYFLGKSSLAVGTAISEIEKRANIRKNYVNESITQLKKLGDVDLRVCGINGFSVLPLDLSFDAVKDRPLWLIYESLNHMAQFVDEYDYFINIEDDIFLPEETFTNIVEFDGVNLVNEVLLPNRLEKSKTGELYCVDTIAIPGWTQQRNRFKNKNLRVSLNPHSAMLILSRNKLKYALNRVDTSFRKPILHNELDSAFAYFHSSFALYRSEDINFNYVIHLDKWMNSPGEAESASIWTTRLNSIRALDFVPPIAVKIASLFLKKS